VEDPADADAWFDAAVGEEELSPYQPRFVQLMF
jgi:hypothetical protein